MSTSTPKQVLIGVLRDTLVAHHQKLKDLPMTMMHENRYTVPRDENFDMFVKELYLYKAKSQDPAGIRRVRIGRSADCPRHVYFWDDEKTLDCVGGNTEEALIEFHRDPVNVAILFELLGMEVLKVGDRQYHVSWDGYATCITERYPMTFPDSDNTEDESDTMEANYGVPEPDETPTPQETTSNQISAEQSPELLEENVRILHEVLLMSFNMMD